MQEIMRPAESSVIVLRNMVDVEGIDDELEVDLRSECEKFGIVNQITVYQERQSEDDDAEIIVKIFVKFRLPSEACRARDALNGRMYAERIIQAELYDQMLYEANDLSG